MNNQGEVTAKWADGTYAFRLTVAGILELEEKCDAPFAVIFDRLSTGKFKVRDVIETIRIGLIGGGAPAAKAMTLVDRYGIPIVENVPIARLIIGGVMFGFEASPLGEAEAAGGTEAESPNVSTPQTSMPPPSPLDAVLQAFESYPFGNSTPQ
jgi:hypothetical protein